MSKILKIWLHAFRLRTLPLSFSCVLLGSALAYNKDFNYLLFTLTLITTLFLQILSNLANDYGDSIKGTDNTDRIGPTRTVQQGSVSILQMKRAIIIFSLLSFVSGLALITIAFGTASYKLLTFLLIGIGAITAAIKYTIGSKPYGYAGFGDLFVFIFFGLVGVIGTYYLHINQFSLNLLLPSSSIGLLSVGVLNLNNIRDREPDKNSGKITIPVMLGEKKAKIYHLILLSLAMITPVFFILTQYSSCLNFLFILAFPLITINIWTVFKIKEAVKFDPLLKKLAIATFIFSILFSISIIIK